jgi:hypothetical protein
MCTVPQVMIVTSGVPEGPSVTILAKCFEICSNEVFKKKFQM